MFKLNVTYTKITVCAKHNNKVQNDNNQKNVQIKNPNWNLEDRQGDEDDRHMKRSWK